MLHILLLISVTTCFILARALINQRALAVNFGDYVHKDTLKDYLRNEEHLKEVEKTKELYKKLLADRQNELNAKHEEKIRRLENIGSAQINAAAEAKFAEWKRKEERVIRQDAVKRSHATVRGNMTEHLVPYLDEFKYDPSDCRFLGAPIDFIVFDGLTEGKDEIKIIFLEVKTGKATLSNREKKIKQAVEARNIEWQTIRKK